MALYNCHYININGTILIYYFNITSNFQYCQHISITPLWDFFNGSPHKFMWNVFKPLLILKFHIMTCFGLSFITFLLHSIKEKNALCEVRASCNWLPPQYLIWHPLYNLNQSTKTHLNNGISWTLISCLIYFYKTWLTLTK